jgi:hypothetical protein
MANLKRSSTPTPPSNLKKNRGVTNKASNSYKEKPWHYKFWYGFPIMEEQAKLAGRPTQEPASLATLRDLGLNAREA